MKTALLALLLLGTPLTAQEITLDLMDVEVYPRVKVYATVLGTDGEPSCELTRDDFKLWELGVPQSLRVLSGKATDTSIALLLDESGSMADVLDAVRTAAQHFVEVMGGSDRAATYSFDNSTYPLHSLIDVSVGKNKQTLIESLERYGTHGGGTELYAAVVELIRSELASERERRRAIVALTDGQSGGSLEAAIQAARAARVSVYTIGMGSADPRALDTLSRETGGRFYALPQPTVEELASIYNDIRLRLQCQYTLIYETPHVCPDGSTLPLRVAVPKLGVERDGEYERPLDFARLDLNLRFSTERQLVVEPPDPLECEKVRFLSHIEAKSCSDELVLENVVVRAYDLRPGDRVEVAKSEPVQVPSNGEAVPAVVEWDTRNFRGKREIELVIDPVDEILERVEEDNLRKVEVNVQELIHDLYIESIEYEPKPAAPCDVVQLSVRIEDGSQCHGLVLPSIEIEGRDGEELLGRATTTLKVGEPEPVVFEWPANGFLGHRALTFVVDPDSKFGVEQTRKNNTKQALVEVSPVLHDLSPVEVSFDPEDPLVGDTVTFRVEVEDRGRCPGIEIGQPVSMRASEAESRKVLGESEPFSVKTESRVIVPVTWETKLADEGARDVVLTVDATGLIREPTPPGKENNAIERRVVVGPMPHDLRPVAAEVEPEVPVDGHVALMRVSVADDARFPGVVLEGVRLKVFDRYQGYLVGESEVRSVISQGETTFEVELDTGGLAGDRELRVVVDPDKEIEELKPDRTDGENNNELVVPVLVVEE